MLALLSRFMGTEMAQNGWWHADEWHRLQWANAEDDIGKLELPLPHLRCPALHGTAPHSTELGMPASTCLSFHMFGNLMAQMKQIGEAG